MQTIWSSLQTDNHTSTLSLNFYGPDSFPDTQSQCRNPVISDLYWNVCAYVAVVKVRMGGTVDPKYYMPAEDAIDRLTFKRVVVGRRSSVKLEFNVAVPESTLRSLSSWTVSSSLTCSLSHVWFICFSCCLYIQCFASGWQDRVPRAGSGA